MSLLGSSSQYALPQRWVDVFPMSAAQGSGNAALTAQVFRDTPGIYPFFRHDQDDLIHFVYQMPHNWVAGTAVDPHLHVIPVGPGGGDAYFRVRWAWSYVGSGGLALPALATWGDAHKPITFTQAQQYIEQPASLGPITPPAWAKASAHLHVTCQRLGTDPLDTYTASNPHGTGAANLCLVSADCHCLVEGPGTVNEYGPT